jgi:hypothetical protein
MTVGTTPLNNMNFGLVDANWLIGVANDQNNSYVSGITATGTTQATSFQLTAGIAFNEIDTTPANAGVALPAAIAGVSVAIYNGSATNALKVYPSIANNGATGAQDTIQGAASVSVATTTAFFFICAKTGLWIQK